jgi:hypothetical protein
MKTVAAILCLGSFFNVKELVLGGFGASQVYRSEKFKTPALLVHFVGLEIDFRSPPPTSYHWMVLL